MDRIEKDNENIHELLDYCSKIPELYNEVANHLNEKWGIKYAELSLLVTYYIHEDRRKAIEQRYIYF